MHMFSKHELCRIGNRESLEKSDDGCNSQRWSANKKKKRSCMSKNWIDLWQYSFSKIHLSLGKLCEDHGYSFEWTSGQKPQTHQRWQTGKMQHGELRTNRCPWFIDKLLNLSNTYISNISLAGSKASRFDKKWEYELPSHEPAENEKKKETSRPYGETRCVICQNG